MIEALVERILASRVDYLASYPARVVAQSADGSLDLEPEDPRIPGLVGVPIRYGVPGVRAKVKSGSRVLVSFERGDPSRPIAAVWESSSVEELTVSADRVRLADGDRPLVREGDPVVVLVTPATASQIVAGGGGPGGIPLAGWVLRGSSKVRGG